jgi:hypothetical protein
MAYPKNDTALVHFNPEGSTPAYKDIYQNVTIIPPGARIAIISSQWACDSTGQLVEGGKGNYKVQSKQMWQNVFTILHAMGCTMENVIHRGNRQLCVSLFLSPLSLCTGYGRYGWTDKGHFAM